VRSSPVPPVTRDARIDIALRNEIKNQCYRAQAAGIELRSLLQQQGIEYDVRVSRSMESGVIHYYTLIWSQVHTILSAAGIVSRILFPRRAPFRIPLLGRPRRDAKRLTVANARAKRIWKSWPLPPRRNLRPLMDNAARNAMEHSENAAAEWFQDQRNFPLLAWGLGKTPPKGQASGAAGAFRFLFQDQLRVKIGDDSCDLNAILSCLQDIENRIPTQSKFELDLPFFPADHLADGTKVLLNYSRISARPPSGP
jgi:hypothetical protein